MALDFSVLVIAHQRHGHLQRLLDGVNRSAHQPAEIIVAYMDEPDPEPVESAVPVTSVHVASYPGEQGLPLARARNHAAKHAQSRYLVFLDVDCIPAPGTFGILLDWLRRQPVLAMAEPRYLAQPLGPGPTPEAEELTRRSTPHHLRAELPMDTPCERHEMFWSLGFGIRAEDFIRLDGFSTGYAGYGAEDTDFGFKASALGLPVVFTPGTVFHQHHGVVKPPLNHFADIIQNARTFRATWHGWPMSGWLHAFEERGLVAWDPQGEDLTILRHPSAEEIRAAQSMDAY